MTVSVLRSVPSPRPLLRLVLCAAVLGCLMGLAQAGPAAATEREANGLAALAAEGAGLAAGHHHAASHKTQPGGRGAEHPGHGSDQPHTHAATCMAATASSPAALPVPAAAGAAPVSLPVVQPAPSWLVALAALPRPPDLATLCVQRV